MRHSSNSFFVTFTYEDSELVYADDEPCVYKRHLQLYFKSLRKKLAPGRIKYYCVGEYGDQKRALTPKGRPHYHALIFYRGDFDWFSLKLLIKELWSYGIAQVLPVLGAQGYVTKYIMKFDKRDHLVKPFSLMSHGLGIDYLSGSMIKYHRRTLNNFGVKPGGYKVKLPRYYQDKIFNQYEKLVMKKRSDLNRRDLERVNMKQIDIMFAHGLNPFKLKVVGYQDRLSASMKLYRMKHKL